MKHEKVKIKMEPGNDIEMRVDAVERIQKRFELEKKLMESKKKSENVNRIIKTEGGENMNYNENDDAMLFKKTKATKMEKDVEALNQKTEMDSKTIEEMRSKLLESVIREQKLVKESNVELRRKESENIRQYLEIEQLRHRMLASEEGKELGESGFGRKESEPDQAMASERLKTEETVEKLMESKKESENVNRIIEKTKATKMEKDVEALKQKTEMDSKTIEEMRSKLSESVIREPKRVIESNAELGRKESKYIRQYLEIEQLRHRMLACEEGKELGESGFGRKESEPDQAMASEQLKTEETVKKLMESKKESENVNRIIKTGEGKIMIYNENDDEMLFEETKVTKMEKDIETLKQKTEMDSKTIEEMRSKLSESEIREQKQIRESNIELRSKESENIQLVEDLRRQNLEIEQLRSRILACEERKELGESGFGRKESAPDQVMARELSKTEETVKNELAIMWRNLVGAPDGSKSKGLEPTYNNDDESRKRKEIMIDCCHVHKRLSLQRK